MLYWHTDHVPMAVDARCKRCESSWNRKPFQLLFAPQKTLKAGGCLSEADYISHIVNP